MIDRAKFQVDVLKNMLSTRPSMRRIDVSECEVGITDGYHVVVFQKSELKIKWESLPILEYDLSKSAGAKTQIFNSGIQKKEKGLTIVKLWSKDKETISFVNAKYVSFFSDCDFFSNGGISEIYAFDGIGSLIGIILPIRGIEF